MVEGGRLEIVLAVLSRYVGSNPTLSANKKFLATGRYKTDDLCGEVAEWSKALAWRASRRLKLRLEGSNPSLSAITYVPQFYTTLTQVLYGL